MRGFLHLSLTPSPMMARDDGYVLLKQSDTLATTPGRSRRGKIKERIFVSAGVVLGVICLTLLWMFGPDALRSLKHASEISSAQGYSDLPTKSLDEFRRIERYKAAHSLRVLGLRSNFAPNFYPRTLTDSGEVFSAARLLDRCG